MRVPIKRGNTAIVIDELAKKQPKPITNIIDSTALLKYIMITAMLTVITALFLETCM